MIGEAHNPILGTRQYPKTGSELIPVSGYASGMTPKEIGKVIRDELDRKKLAQEAFAEEIGIGQSTMSRIILGQFKRMPSELPRICAKLGLPLPDLDGKASGAAPRIPRQTIGDRDFPVYASAEGGPGEIIRSTDPIDFIPRPSPVAHVKEAYGMVVTGTSMWPECRPGETLLVNPLLPVLGDEVHIFYSEIEGEARASVKHLRRATPTEWLVTQHSPPKGKTKDFALSRREWRWAHRVFGKYSRQ